MSDKMSISRDEFYQPKVEEILAQQEAMRRAAPPAGPPSWWRRVVFNSIFFLAVAGALGGLAGWAIIEPFFAESIDLWGTIEEIQSEARFAQCPRCGQGVSSAAGTDSVNCSNCGAPVLLSSGGMHGSMIAVKGVRVYLDRRVARVQGRGEFSDVRRPDDLKVGMPVHVQAMPLGAGDFNLGGRISVRSLSAEQLARRPANPTRTKGLGLVVALFAFAIIGSAIAGLIAAADGFMSRNARRAALCGIVGIGTATAGGLIGTFVGALLLGLCILLVRAVAGEGIWTSETLTGWPFLLLMVGRSLTWGVLGTTVGLGQGVALRSRKLLQNGMLGGMLGGLLGGMFFEPIIKLFANTDLGGQAIVSRAFGFAIIGLSAGFMMGLVEHLAKDAWLLMRAGPLAGKQFILYKSPTVLGSSPKAEVYLFKDAEIEPRHAAIHKVGNRHEIEDLSTRGGTFVNGQQIKRQVLHDHDQVVVGQTVLEYSERPRGAA